VLLLIGYEVTTPTQSVMDYSAIDYNSDIIKLLTEMLMGLLTFLALLIFISMSCTFGPLAIKNAWAQRQLELGKPTLEEELPQVGTVAYLLRMGPEPAGVYDGTCSTGAMMVYHIFSSCFFVSDTVVLLHLIYLLFGIAGNLVSPFFLCLHLFDLVYTSETLKNVLRAVTFNGGQLLMTSVLGFLIIYLYTILSFMYLRQNYLNDDVEGVNFCDSFLDCYMVNVREGIINGGGMGDWLQGRSIVADWGSWMARFLFDITFFLLIIIILLNIVFGIIIDTFSAMREATENAAGDMKTVCTMCGLERADLDRHGSGFDQHIKLEHNMWKYLYYAVYLLQKDPTEYTGLETYVSEMIEEEDMEFYPLEKALCMEEEEEEEDPFRLEVDEKLRDLENSTSMMKKTLADIKTEATINQAVTMGLTRSRLLVVNRMCEKMDEDNGYGGKLREMQMQRALPEQAQ